MKIQATRYHDFSMGHRVVGHEGHCRWLHGHNYRVHFTVEAPELDSVGRVVDFSCIKSQLCQWLEDNWDHKMVLWSEDNILDEPNLHPDAAEGLRYVPFNPTAENIAQYLLSHVGPEQFKDFPGVVLVKVVVEETRKCSCTAEL